MDQKQIARQVMSFNKTTFDNNFKAIKLLNEQAEKIFSQVMGMSPLFSEEGKKAMLEWMKTYNKGCDDFKKIMDEKFAKIEDHFKDKE